MLFSGCLRAFPGGDVVVRSHGAWWAFLAGSPGVFRGGVGAVVLVVRRPGRSRFGGAASFRVAPRRPTGQKSFLVCYPHGYCRKDALEIAGKNGYYVINWSFGCDWDMKLGNEELYEKYAGAVKKGAIFLMHDSNTKAVNILADLIDKLREDGYEIVTVSELLGLKARGPGGLEQ